MNLVQLANFRGRIEAEMAGQLLEQSSIRYLIQCEDHPAAGVGYISAPRGAAILVSADQHKWAREILVAYGVMVAIS